jgi:hypothetical protein
MAETIVHINTEDVGVIVTAGDDGGLDITVDSRHTWIAKLTADTETAVRLGDLFTAAKDLLGDAINTEYARGMAELIGYFAPEGDQFDSEHMRDALGGTP